MDYRSQEFTVNINVLTRLIKEIGSRFSFIRDSGMDEKRIKTKRYI